MRKMIIILSAFSFLIIVATQLVEYRLLDGEYVISPDEIKSFDVSLYKGGLLRVEAYSKNPVYITQRILMIYVLDDIEYYSFIGTNSTLKEAIRAAHVAAWQVSTDETENAVYFDRVDHDSKYHIILDNNPPALFSSDPKVVELHVTVKSPLPVLSYLAIIPIVVAVVLYIIDRS